MLLRQNSKGQITKELGILINKKLQAVAREVDYDIKPKIRTELENVHKQNIYESFGPITDTGKLVEKYNEEHKHQKARPYHHTGILLRNVKAVTDENVVKIVVGEEVYPNTNKTARQVYDWLKYGTTDTPEKTHYRFKNKKGDLPLVTYVPTPKHHFEEKTLIHMEDYIKRLVADIQAHPENYVRKALR